LTNRAVGQFGEDEAARAYEKSGYAVVARNVHTRWGESDIIAQNGEYLVFCEVKTRSSAAMGSPAEAVTRRKTEHLRRAAELWLAENPTQLQPRFDVACVEVARRGGGLVLTKLEIIENAF